MKIMQTLQFINILSIAIITRIILTVVNKIRSNFDHVSSFKKII